MKISPIFPFITESFGEKNLQWELKHLKETVSEMHERLQSNEYKTKIDRMVNRLLDLMKETDQETIKLVDEFEKICLSSIRKE